MALSDEKRRRVTIFTDAQGQGGVGGVMFCEHHQPVYFADHLDDNFLSSFKHRKSSIMPLEMGAVHVALHRFRQHIVGANLILYIDNKSVLYSLRKSNCKAPDVHKLVQITCDLIASLGCVVKYVWVPSAWNVADPPSRGTSLPFAKTDVTSSVTEMNARLRST